MEFVVGVFGIVFLFLLSRELSKLMSGVMYLLTRHESFAIFFLSFLFLPGVVVHELAHLLVANVLLVPTGEVEFLPQVHGHEVKLGSVAIAKTDIVRRFIIGIAPLIIGLSVLVILFLFLYPFMLLSWKSALMLYAIFEIGNTMFSSRKDMEGTVGFLVLVSLVVVAGYFFGIRISPQILLQFLSPNILSLASTIDELIFIALGVDIGIIAILGTTKKLVTKLR